MTEGMGGQIDIKCCVLRIQGYPSLAAAQPGQYDTLPGNCESRAAGDGKKLDKKGISGGTSQPEGGDMLSADDPIDPAKLRRA
ncbi:MAG TPA: hypothetical protein DHV36_19635 [Desulfobacteraceae bacterium]|nr:hypothetical protein [Desulfobacteraceae bacterium]